MKVGIVVPFSWSFWGGVVEHAEHQARALRDRGIETRTIIGNDPPGTFTRFLHPRSGRHGYELIEGLPELVGEERVDVGNLYRFLRALEEDGIVESEWDGDLPGPARRTYQLTDTGRTLLRRWADALRQAQIEIAQFLERHDEQRR